MKKFLAVLMAMALCLTVAGCKSYKPEPLNTDLLEYPGTHWGDSPETVMEELGLSPDEVEQGEEEAGGYHIGMYGQEYFGALCDAIVFRFEADNSGAYCLTRVEISYPDDTDLSPVCKALEELYGPKVHSYFALESSPLDSGETVYSVQEKAPSGEILGLWISVPPSSYFSDAGKEDIRTLLCEEAITPMPQDIFEEYWTFAPMVTLKCTNDAYPQFQNLPENTNRKAVIFSASPMRWFQNHFTNG